VVEHFNLLTQQVVVLAVVAVKHVAPRQELLDRVVLAVVVVAGLVAVAVVFLPLVVTAAETLVLVEVQEVLVHLLTQLLVLQHQLVKT
jgi:hypothetical protein